MSRSCACSNGRKYEAVSLFLFGTFFLVFQTFLFPRFSLAIDETRFASYVEQHPDGYIDWSQRIVFGIGKSYLDKNGGSRRKTMQAARTIAIRSLMNVVANIRLDDQKTLKILQEEGAVLQLRALVKYEVFEIKPIAGKRPGIEVTVQAPITGIDGLSVRLLDRLKMNPLPWKPGFPRQPAGTSPGDGDEDSELWLVIDARKLSDPLKPAMYPKIVDRSGKTLYDISIADSDAFRQNGLIRYVTSDEAPDKDKSGNERKHRFLSFLHSLFSPGDAFAGENKRKKRKKFIVKDAKEAKGLFKTNIVVSVEDAKNLKEKDAAAKILKKCRVIVVLNSPIGGIEGALPEYFARSF